jgi:hypothetical protein
MSVSAGNLLLRMVVTLLCILWLLAVVRPNVRAKREATVWRLAREADDNQHGLAGQAARRWLSA